MGPIMASKQELHVLESWEDIEDPDELEKRFGNLIAPGKSMEVGTNGNLTQPVNIILTGDDALRTQYVPPEPTVKILKRPSKDAPSNSDLKAFQPKKTLQQREQEYAKARRRILGETKSEKISERISIQKPRSLESENLVVLRMPKGPDGTSGFKIHR